jgi:hypothetical protein
MATASTPTPLRCRHDQLALAWADPHGPIGS